MPCFWANVEQSLKVFGDLMNEVKEYTLCKLTDLKVVLGSDRREMLYTTMSTKYVNINNQNVDNIKPKHVKEKDAHKALEGSVISIHIPSQAVVYAYNRFSATVEVKWDFTNSLHVTEWETTPKIAFTFKKC